MGMYILRYIHTHIYICIYIYIYIYINLHISLHGTDICISVTDYETLLFDHIELHHKDDTCMLTLNIYICKYIRMFINNKGI